LTLTLVMREGADRGKNPLPLSARQMIERCYYMGGQPVDEASVLLIPWLPGYCFHPNVYPNNIDRVTSGHHTTLRGAHAHAAAAYRLPTLGRSCILQIT
jgi:hypothetical protein